MNCLTAFTRIKIEICATMKKILIPLFCILSFNSFAQKVESIYLNLYTDSLKKGTYNYINVDGKMLDGSYRPLDSTYVNFETDYGHFEGNNLVLDAFPSRDKVHLIIALKTDKKICKEITIYIKQMDDPPLLNEQEVLEQMRKVKRNNA